MVLWSAALSSAKSESWVMTQLCLRNYSILWPQLPAPFIPLQKRKGRGVAKISAPWIRLPLGRDRAGFEPFPRRATTQNARELSAGDSGALKTMACPRRGSNPARSNPRVSRIRGAPRSSPHQVLPNRFLLRNQLREQFLALCRNNRV